MNNFPQYRDREGDEWTRFEDGLLYLTTSWRSERTRKGYTFGFVDWRFGPLVPIPSQKEPSLEKLRKRSQDAETHYAIANGRATDLIDAHVDYITALEKEVTLLRARVEEAERSVLIRDMQPDPRERREAIDSLARFILQHDGKRKMGAGALAELIVDKSALVWLSSDKRQLREQVKDLQQKNNTLSRQLGSLRDAVRELYRQV